MRWMRVVGVGKLSGALAECGDLGVFSCGKAFGEPHEHRYVDLFGDAQKIGRAVQIEAFFSEALTMIRYKDKA